MFVFWRMIAIYGPRTSPRLQGHKSLDLVECTSEVPIKCIHGSYKFRSSDARAIPISNGYEPDSSLDICLISSPHHLYKVVGWASKHICYQIKKRETKTRPASES
ncbi:hypothetical protein CHS0354_039536 [Potamilus streckersoni]|uniref:Uncharacterized protein n=1 Tax=Potamilus streckersoni TaxID=2493646 RepID=A0AAE0WFV4_9BIVA|nr:hypothetical protein CHS0354_039536 [Potamilus streckersoni]